MEGPQLTWIRQAGAQSPGQETERLHRALVAGLILEVVLDAPELPEDPRLRRHQVKARLKSMLVANLAGHIPLRTFRTLTRNLDHWFDLYYPLVTAPAGRPGQNVGMLAEIQVAYTCEKVALPASAIQAEHLRQELEGLQELLPRRRHRKLDQERLTDFLWQTQGEWFRLGDFQNFFGIDRKTAWEYVQKLLQAGLLEHNQGRSASVRYRLAPRFVEE